MNQILKSQTHCIGMDNTCSKFQELTRSKAFRYAVYLALLATTLVFVTSMIREYLDGATFTRISEEPATIDDVPVATICIAAETALKYGVDFTIQVQKLKIGDQNTSFVSLSEGFNNYEYFNKRTIQVRQLTVTQELYMLKMSCVSLKMIMKELCTQLFGTFNCSQLFGVFIINLSKKMQKKIKPK